MRVNTVVAFCLSLSLLAVPVAAAYETHLINVDARIVRPVVLGRQVHGPQRVPIQSYREWVITYKILNIYDFPMTEVKATDTFGSYLNAQLLKADAGEYRQTSNKAGDKWRFNWQVNRLERRQAVTLMVKVATGRHKDRQVFLNRGKHTISTGPTLSWRNNLGQVQTTSSPPFKVVSY